MVDSFIYPRRITIKRQAKNDTLGVSGYSGMRAATETTVASNLPASIQHFSTSLPNESNLPGNAYGRGRWRIFIPIEGGGVKSLGINRNDTVVDDEGDRYQVNADYFDSLGWRLEADKIEV